MDRVLVVCGAGASSTFLAVRMRTRATARDMQVSARAGSVGDVDTLLPDIDVLLVGPHLEAEFADLAARARRVGLLAALLPPTVFGPHGADEALDLAVGLLAAAAH